jgi:hypothetical protein
MGYVARGVAYRARDDARQSRLGRLLLVSAFNLVVWSGLILLIARLA